MHGEARDHHFALNVVASVRCTRVHWGERPGSHMTCMIGASFLRVNQMGSAYHDSCLARLDLQVRDHDDWWHGSSLHPLFRLRAACI